MEQETPFERVQQQFPDLRGITPPDSPAGSSQPGQSPGPLSQGQVRPLLGRLGEGPLPPDRVRAMLEQALGGNQEQGQGPQSEGPHHHGRGGGQQKNPLASVKGKASAAMAALRQQVASGSIAPDLTASGSLGAEPMPSPGVNPDL